MMTNAIMYQQTIIEPEKFSDQLMPTQAALSFEIGRILSSYTSNEDVRVTISKPAFPTENGFRCLNSMVIRVNPGRTASRIIMVDFVVKEKDHDKKSVNVSSKSRNCQSQS